MRKFNNFTDVAKAMRVRIHTPKKVEDVRKCRKCGKPMHRIEGTNIYACENGECGNTAMTAKLA